MWIKEIAIGCPHVPPGRSAASAFQHELPRHELATIFADRACRRTKAGMGPIGAAGPFPYIAEHLAKCRSEEHTSELQSLMRISYAVFCLKKKINYTIN